MPSYEDLQKMEFERYYRVEKRIYLHLARMCFGEYFTIPEKPKESTKAEFTAIVKNYIEQNQGVYLTPDENQVIKSVPQKRTSGYLINRNLKLKIKTSQELITTPQQQLGSSS